VRTRAGRASRTVILGAMPGNRPVGGPITGAAAAIRPFGQGFQSNIKAGSAREAVSLLQTIPTSRA
jgi:hypothetical protein